MIKAPAQIEVLHFFERPPWDRRWLAFGLGVVFAVVDFFTGPYILFPVFFILPVMLMAWNCGLRCAIGLAVILSLARFSFHFAWDFPWTVGVAVLNAVMRCSVLVLLAAVTARLANYTRVLRDRVQLLEGILPICAFCKDIRDEGGNWQQMESYVGKRSDAEFSHGVCPKCAEIHYGEYLRKGRNV